MSYCNSVPSVAPLLACADLERLSMRGCRVPPSELAALKAALPRLHINVSCSGVSEHSDDVGLLAAARPPRLLFPTVV
jgi:hypothetical protein